MIVTFDETGKEYEIQNDEVDTIFELVKDKIQDIYNIFTNDKDVLIAVIASGCIVEDMIQMLSNQYGADYIIKTIDAKEI